MPLALPFLLWRRAVCMWATLWLAPLGLRVVVEEPERAALEHARPCPKR